MKSLLTRVLHLLLESSFTSRQTTKNNQIHFNTTAAQFNTSESSSGDFNATSAPSSQSTRAKVYFSTNSTNSTNLLDDNVSQSKNISSLKEAKKHCKGKHSHSVRCGKALAKAWKETKDDIKEQEKIERFILKNVRKLDTQMVLKTNKRIHKYAISQNMTILEPFPEHINETLEAHNLFCELKHEYSKNHAQAELIKRRTGNFSNPDYSIDKMMEYGYLANFPYFQNASTIPDGWELNRPLARALALDSGFHYHKKSGQVYTMNGLTAYPFVKKDASGEVEKACLVFGGTTAARRPGSIFRRLYMNTWETFGHFGANIENAMGFSVPEIYKQAEQLAKHFEDRTRVQADPPVKSAYAGHSLGASMCTYVSGMVSNPHDPSPCYGFSPAPLNGAMQKDIVHAHPKVSHIDKIASNIRHVKIQGDKITDVRNPFSGAKKVGVYYKVELNGTDAEGSMFVKHGKYLRFISKWKP